jgi:hypothetical protein
VDQAARLFDPEHIRTRSAVPDRADPRQTDRIASRDRARGCDHDGRVRRARRPEIPQRAPRLSCRSSPSPLGSCSGSLRRSITASPLPSGDLTCHRVPFLSTDDDPRTHHRQGGDLQVNSKALSGVSAIEPTAGRRRRLDWPG